MNIDKKLTVHCDGGARGNPGPGAGAAVIEHIAGNVRYLCGKYLGVVTNNQAEYEGVKIAFEVIRDRLPMGVEAEVYLDSLLVARQLSGQYKVKNEKLRELLFQIKSLEAGWGQARYEHIPREKNTTADSLVNQAIDQRKSFLRIEQIN